MNDSVANVTGGNSTAHESFWDCVSWQLRSKVDYDLALALCSYLPTPFQDENRKVGAASCVVGTVGLLMNGVVLYGIRSNRALRKPMDLFVANLAAADCVACLFSFFLCAITQSGLLPPQVAMGLFCMFFLVLVLSAVGVLLLSVDRYLAILHPIFYQTRMSTRHVVVSLGISWPACVLICLSPLMALDCSSTAEHVCKTDLPLAYRIVINVVLCLAVVLVVFINAKICIVLKKRFSRAGPLENPGDDVPAARRRDQRVAEREHRQLRRGLKTVVTVVIIAALFIVSWLPICAGFVRDIACHVREDCEREARAYWGLMIALCGSVTNPVVYAFRLKQIRDALRRKWRRLANAVRGRLGLPSNQVQNVRIVGGAALGMEAAGPSTHNRAGQTSEPATRRRALNNAENTDNSTRSGTLTSKLPSAD